MPQDLPDSIPTGRSGEIGLEPTARKGEGKTLPRPLATPSILASINDPARCPWGRGQLDVERRGRRAGRVATERLADRAGEELLHLG